MANPGYTPETVAQYAAEFKRALAEGHAPPGVPVGAYRRGARGVAGERMGVSLDSAIRMHAAAKRAGLLDKPRVRVRAGSEPGIDWEARRLALDGEIGGPPIPEIAIPPDGFIVTRNSGAYDADGNLLRQWVGTQVAPGEIYVPPPGHTIKGESALLTPEGRVMQRWVKTKEGAGEGLIEALRATFAAYDGAAPTIPTPMFSDDDLLTFYPVPDLHFGALAWGRETGESYDINIAADMAVRSIQSLVDQSKPSKHACLVFMGDYFHANDEKGVTPGSGHRLDVDARWQKVFAAGAKLATMLVEIIARKHEAVSIRCLKGNHDIDSSVCLMVALSLFYSGSDRITVDDDPAIAWYYRFGKCLLAATHGHTMKPETMVLMMTVDRAVDWGVTAHKHMFFGHIHHVTSKEIAGVRVESLSSPAGRDAWNAEHGYRSSRSLSAITFHREEGEIGRHRVNITKDQFKAAA